RIDYALKIFISHSLDRPEKPHACAFAFCFFRLGIPSSYDFSHNDRSGNKNQSDFVQEISAYPMG
ncbi:MAG: hypothetical protein LBF27_01690, partial [Sphingobacterium sp.]|nr:hypothetical protein [Sphingobacterium sp.]